MASPDELAGAVCPLSSSSSSSSSPSGVPLHPEERLMSTIGVSSREELRGLGEELLRLDFRAHGDGPRRRRSRSSWSDTVPSIVADADRDLYDALRPFDDHALLQNHGEQLLDFVIRLASEQQWKRWVVNSMQTTALTCATNVLLRLFASYGDSMDDGTLSRVLSVAGEGGNVEILSVLIAAGAGPLVREVDEVTWRFTALHLAAKHGHRSFVAKLIEAGAPVDSRHVIGGTALTEAVEGGHKGVALELLAAGADVNKIVDIRFHHRMGASFAHGDFTPLCIAVDKNDEEMVKALLEAEADPAKGPAECLPLHLAAIQGSYEIINSLLLAGASVRSVDNEGRSALHLACAHNQHDAVDLLLRHNASVASLCNNGLSPNDVVGAQVLALRQQGPLPRPGTASLIWSYPSTLNSAETSTVDNIFGLLQSSSAWGRRGWLVMMRARPLAEGVEQPEHNDSDNLTLSVRDICLTHEPSSNAAGLREEGGTERALHDGGHARTDWSAAVVWLLQGPDESIFRIILCFL